MRGWAPLRAVGLSCEGERTIPALRPWPNHPAVAEEDPGSPATCGGPPALGSPRPAWRWTTRGPCMGSKPSHLSGVGSCPGGIHGPVWPVLSWAPPPRAEVGAGEAVACSEDPEEKPGGGGGEHGPAVPHPGPRGPWRWWPTSLGTGGRHCLGREVLGPPRRPPTARRLHAGGSPGSLGTLTGVSPAPVHCLLTSSPA